MTLTKYKVAKCEWSLHLNFEFGIFPFTRRICRLYFYQFIDHILTIYCSLSFSSAITSKHHISLQAIISTFPSSGKISLFVNLKCEKDYVLNFVFFIVPFATRYCKHDISFFTFIIKVMHVYCGKFGKYKKVLRQSPGFSVFYVGYLVNCGYLNFMGNIYQMDKGQLDKTANCCLSLGNREVG